MYGGNHWNGVGSVIQNPFDDILFLNMDDGTSTWKTLPGVKLAGAHGYINGGLVKLLTDDECFMMYVASTTRQLWACTGNYHWTATNITPGIQFVETPLVPVEINSFINCV